MDTGGDGFYNAALVGTSAGENSTDGQALVADNDGTVYTFGDPSNDFWGCNSAGATNKGYPSTIEDRNGNIINLGILPGCNQNQSFTVTDTAKRSVMTTSGFGQNPNTITVAGQGGSYQITWGAASPTGFGVSDNKFGSTGCPDVASYDTDGSVPGSTVIQQITLPNNKSYTFQYNSPTGNLSQITYPNGGFVRYTWGTYSLGGFLSYYAKQPTSSSGVSSCLAAYDIPAVVARDVSYDGSTIAEHQSFTYNIQFSGAQYAAWATRTTTVTTTDNVANTTSTVTYNYVPQPGGGQAGRATLSSQVTADQNGAALETVQKSWLTLNEEACETHTQANGQLSATFYSYAATGLPNDVKQYDYGQLSSSSVCQGQGGTGTNTAPSATPARETVTAFQSFAAAPNFPAKSVILDKPSSVSAYDHGAQIAQTTYGYGGSSPVPATATSHDAAYESGAPSTGNPTSITRKCLQSCADATTSYTYDTTGQVASITDPLNHTTTFSYADSPAGGNAGGNSNAYLTQIAGPNTGVAHTSGYSYNYASGTLTQSVDENGQATNYSYNDPFLRQTDVYGPASAQNNNQRPHTNAAYVDGAGATVTTTDPNGATTIASLDGLGRTIKTQLTTDPSGADTVDTVYDGLGRTHSVSNPYRTKSDPTYGVTTYAYDGLGRLTQQTDADGSNKQTFTWTGNTVDFRNENSHDWQRTYDAFGDLSTVVEPDGGNNPAYRTDYQYDARGNLTHVDQWGGPQGNAGDRVRSLVYDGLSRLTSSTSPESGTTTYTYDGASNVHTKTDARGVVTSYTYDALNRPTGKSYANDPSNTPAVSLNYDSPKPGWTLPSQTYPSATPGTTLNQIAQSNLVGQLSYAANGNATMVYGYDEAGRTVLKSVCTPSTCAAGDHYDMHALYDLAGNATFTDLGVDSARNAATPNAGYYYGGLAMSYVQSGQTAGQLLTGTADIVDGTHPANIVSGLQYSPLGGMTSGSFSSVYGEGNTYSPRGWIASRYGQIVGGLERTGTLTHDPAGNVTQLNDSLVGTTQYTVDQLNRLTSASNTTSSGAVYGYDAWGNLTTRTTSSGSGYNYSLTMTPNNQISQTGSTDSAFQYDASGNVLADGINSYGYDGEGRLAAVNGSTQYQYAPDGTRVATVSGGAVTAEYLYGMGGELATTVDAMGKLIRGALYGGGMHLADYTAGTGAGGGKTEFHLSDQVGSLVDTVDQTGAIVEGCAAQPFGEALTCSPSVDFSEVHYADSKRDQESNLDSFGARFYSSITGRFVSPDPSQLDHADPANPQSLNLYSYAQNNPLLNTDPTGLTCQTNSSDGVIYDDLDGLGCDKVTQADAVPTISIVVFGESAQALNPELNQGSSMIQKNAASMANAPSSALSTIQRIYNSGCVGSALSGNAASLSLDVLGVALAASPLGPEAKIIGAIGLGVTSTVVGATDANSATAKGRLATLGAVANIFGIQTAPLELAQELAQFSKGAGKVLTGVGVGADLATVGIDIKTCLSKQQ